MNVSNFPCTLTKFLTVTVCEHKKNGGLELSSFGVICQAAEVAGGMGRGWGRADRTTLPALFLWHLNKPWGKVDWACGSRRDLSISFKGKEKEIERKFLWPTAPGSHFQANEPLSSVNTSVGTSTKDPL